MIFDEESFIYSPTVWEEMEVNFRSMKHACLWIAFPANDPRFGGRGNIEAVIPTTLIIYKHKYNSVLQLTTSIDDLLEIDYSIR